MQLKPVFRVITVILVSVGVLVVVAIAVPPSPVQGNEFTRTITGSLDEHLACSPSLNPRKVGITDTTSTTPTTTLTETAVLTPTTSPTSELEITPTATVTIPTQTATPTEEPTTSASLTPEPTVSEDSPEPSPTPEVEKRGIISNLIGLLKAKPLIPLGFMLIALVSALTLILITAQRKTKTRPAPTREDTSTAPLLPKITPAHEAAFLRLKDQPEITFPLAIDDIRIGRSSDNTIVITPEMPGAETVSRYHARLYRLERWILEDLDSSNGIYVNGQRTGRNYLRNGWEIGIGGVIFTFHTGKVEV